jgi:hypothetical protein
MIVRRHHNGNFTIVPNRVFEDDRLSVEAKGVLGYLLSRPHDWTIRLVQIGPTLKIGRDKLERIFKELIEAGYVLRGDQTRTKCQQWGPTEYIVLDQPEHVAACPTEETQQIEADPPCPEKPFTAEPCPANQGTYKGLKENKKDSVSEANASGATAPAVEDDYKPGLFDNPPRPKTEPPETRQAPSDPVASGAGVLLAQADPKLELFRDGLADLATMGLTDERAARRLLGKWLRDARGDAAQVTAAIVEAKAAGPPADPIPYITRLLHLRQNHERARPLRTHSAARPKAAGYDATLAGVARFAARRGLTG